MMEFSAKKMPTLFVGHGSPMNAIEANVFSANWSRLAGQMPRPEAILAISAHWYTSGSGNVVHNLARIQWGMDGGLPWAVEFDTYIKDRITERQFEDVIQYRKAGKSSELAFYTPDHFYPLLYVLGASSPDDALAISSQICTMGSMSMTCYLFQ